MPPIPDTFWVEGGVYGENHLTLTGFPVQSLGLVALSAQSVNICSPFSKNLLTSTIVFSPIFFVLVGLYS